MSRHLYTSTHHVESLLCITWVALCCHKRHCKKKTPSEFWPYMVAFIVVIKRCFNITKASHSQTIHQFPPNNRDPSDMSGWLRGLISAQIWILGLFMATRSMTTVLLCSKNGMQFHSTQYGGIMGHCSYFASFFLCNKNAKCNLWMWWGNNNWVWLLAPLCQH